MFSFFVLSLNAFSEIRHEIFLDLVCALGIFFLGFDFSPFDHPRHLKSGVPQVPLPGENTFFAVFTFEASCASANVVLLGIPHIARSAVQAGLTGAKILLKETQFQ